MVWNGEWTRVILSFKHKARVWVFIGLANWGLHSEGRGGVGPTWRVGLVWAPLGAWGWGGLHLEGGAGVGSTLRAGLVCAPLWGRGWCGLHLEGGVGVGPTWRVGLVWAALGGWGWCGVHLEGGVGVGSTWRAGFVWAPLGGWGWCRLHLGGGVMEGGVGKEKEDKPLYFPKVFSRINPEQRVILFQGMQLHRKAAEERLSGNTVGMSFLARQRQASSRRSTPNRTQQTAAVGSRFVLLY